MKSKPFYRSGDGDICLYEDNPPITVYVNPHTGELCKLDYAPDTHNRSIEALKGQGVTAIGTWYPGHFQNWGHSVICRKWKFSGYSKNARYLERALTQWVERFNLMQKSPDCTITLGAGCHA